MTRVSILRQKNIDHLTSLRYVRSILEQLCTMITQGFPILTSHGLSKDNELISADLKSKVYMYSGKNAWLLSPGTSSQSEGYTSKRKIWLVLRGDPLLHNCTSILGHSNYSAINFFLLII